MKLTIDLENLEQVLQNSIEINVENATKEAIYKVAEKQANDKIKSIIEEKVDALLSGWFDEWLNTTKITVGNSWKNEEIKTYTIEEYLKATLHQKLEKQEFNVKDRRGYDTEVTLKSYITKVFDIDNEMSTIIKKHVDSAKKETMEKVNVMFNENTRENLSDVLFNLLMQNESYQKIQSSIKLLGN